MGILNTQLGYLTLNLVACHQYSYFLASPRHLVIHSPLGVQILLKYLLEGLKGRKLNLATLQTVQEQVLSVLIIMVLDLQNILSNR